MVASVGSHRVGAEAELIPYLVWRRLEEAAPDVELVPIDGWVEADRATKEPAELERIAAACAVGDRALATLLPKIRPGATERDLALELEWLLRTGGAEAVAFKPTCLVGPNAALPHGAPSDAEVRAGEVVLFDFGAQVGGYRSDMTRTLFVGEPSERDLGVYQTVARAQAAAIDQLDACVDGDLALPSGRDLDGIARRVIESDGRWPAYGHGLGHGIGLATHERPSLSPTALDASLPSPSVFSVEPGIYLEGETGVRIEDLILLDAGAGRVERLTHFPREVIVVGT
jgi:Xaa-Pro aminopeptidase